MADDKAEQTLPEEYHEASGGESAGAEAAEEEIPLEEMSAEQLLEALEEAQIAVVAAKDQALRAQAEAENVRRRALRDVEHAHKFALERFAAELLPVIDSLEKSLEAASGDSEPEAIAEAVELSLKLALAAMEKSGLTRIDPEGEPFDPEFHEAMGMLESADAEPGSVLHVLQKGYLLNERLVRAAKVMVAKSPADEQPAG
jgi:molecular chaperone GrpE